MRTHQRLLVTATIALLLVATACGSGGSQSQKEVPVGVNAGPVKIGVVGPMTGLASFVGKNMVEGIQLAVEDINSKGGVDGRQVQYVVRDDEADPAKTSTAVRELIEKENVSALFGPAGSSNYLSIARLITDDKIP